MTFLSILGAKFYYFLQRKLKLSKNDMAGRIALKLDRNFLINVKKPPLVIAVTGTNGKTTTCNLLVDILEDNGYKVASNRGGANFRPGIALALLKGVTIFNKPKVDYLITECDELSSQFLFPALKPNFLIVSNLFRDSMRRNAYPEYIFDVINKSLSQDTVLILNANDPISSRLGSNNKKVFYDINKLPTDKKTNNSLVQDITICPLCQHKLIYDYVRYHHIGKVHCSNCDFKSPNGDYKLTKIDKNKIYIKNNNKEEMYSLISDSIFNIYNELSIIALLKELNFSSKQIENSLQKQKIAEIRLKESKINNTEVIVHMTKGQNSIATSRVFEYVSTAPGTKEVIIMIDDVYDKIDSSETIAWLYDADFEFLKRDDIKRIIVGGVRYKDYLLRLLIAGIPKEKIFATYKEIDTPQYLDLNNTDKVYILYEIFAKDIAFQIHDEVCEKLSNRKVTKK